MFTKIQFTCLLIWALIGVSSISLCLLGDLNIFPHRHKTTKSMNFYAADHEADESVQRIDYNISYKNGK